MRKALRRVVAPAVVFVLVPSPADGHSGGTDRFGCHRDSRTGLRHCHSDEVGEGPALVGEAGVAIEVGGRFRGKDGRPFDLSGLLALHVAHDGTLLTMLGVGARMDFGGAKPAGSYVDLALGVASIPGTTDKAAFRLDLGLYGQFATLGTERIALVFKGGVIIEKIEGTPTSSLGLGLSLALHFSVRQPPPAE